MKRLVIIAILSTICGMTAMAQDRPTGTHHSTGGDRGGITSFVAILQAEFVDPYIEVYGCEDASYDVIVSTGSSVVWNEIIGGEYGNVINYEFSTTRSYVITLTSLQQGTTFVWKLENGVLNGSGIPNLGNITNQKKIIVVPLEY